MNDVQVFHSSFPLLWKWTTGGASVLGLIIIVAAIWTGEFDEEAAIYIGLFTLFAGGMLAIAVGRYPVYISPTNLRCYNECGKYATIPWNSITAVKPGHVMGMRYLVVTSNACSSELWVPLYLSDMYRFVTTVQQFAGDENPLTKELLLCSG